MFIFIEESKGMDLYEEYPIKAKDKPELYEIFTTYVTGYTPHIYHAGDTIPSIGFGSLDKKIWAVDHGKKRYYVTEAEW